MTSFYFFLNSLPNSRLSGLNDLCWDFTGTTRIPSVSTTTGNIIFTVTSTDSDSSQLYYNMTVVPPGGPFTIHNCKSNVSGICLISCYIACR